MSDELEFRTCLECRKNKPCHPVLAVCEECWNTVMKPAIVRPEERPCPSAGERG